MTYWKPLQTPCRSGVAAAMVYKKPSKVKIPAQRFSAQAYKFRGRLRNLRYIMVYRHLLKLLDQPHWRLTEDNWRDKVKLTIVKASVRLLGCFWVLFCCWFFF